MQQVLCNICFAPRAVNKKQGRKGGWLRFKVWKDVRLSITSRPSWRFAPAGSVCQNVIPSLLVIFVRGTATDFSERCDAMMRSNASLLLGSSQIIEPTNPRAMPRLFEGTSTKRRPGLGLGGGFATDSSASSASAGLTLEPAGANSIGGNSNNSNSRRNRNNQQQSQRRTAMDLIDTDDSSSEEDGCGGFIDSSFDFDDPEEKQNDRQRRRVKGKENDGNLVSSGAQQNSKSKSQQQQSRQPKKIVVTDKAKASSKKGAASASSAPTKKKRGATSSKKSATTAASSKKNSSNGGGGVKAKASASKATKSTKKRSPSRVRFEGDAASNENNAQTPANNTTAAPTTATSSAGIPPPTISVPPRAVAVDTRTVQSFEGDAAGTAFLRHTLSFLKSCARRGMLPPILAVTTASGGGGGGGGAGGVVGIKKTKRSTTIGTKVVHLPTDRLTGREYAVENDSAFGVGGGFGGGTTSGMTGAMGAESLLPPEAQEEQMYWRDILLESAVSIRCASTLASMDGGDGSNGDGGGTGRAGNVPKPLLAHDSWKYFADLVKSVDGQIQRDNAGATAGSSFHRPRTLTIFTNDVALFSDTAVDSHKRALGRFWDTIRGSFENGSVGSVQIAIYETGAAALVQGRKCKGNNQAKDSEASSLEGDIFDENRGEGEDATEQETEEEVAATDEALGHRMRVKQCIALLQREIQSLQEKDRRRSATPISMELLVIESPIKFQTLLRDWISDIISPASGTEGGTISFNLPETLDGSQCALSLDLVPSLLPHRVDSSEAAKLMADLKALSLAELEVVQVVPISSVDGSLLYGVPMSATAAMDSDLFRYKDMKVLTRQLFRYMAMKDVAIALRCVGTRGLEGKGAKNATADFVEEGQIFLLMAEHPAESTDQPLSSSSLSSSTAPSRGILYRYATFDHIIHYHETVDALDNDSEDEEMSEQYFEYVEQSLEMVDSKILNPILLPSTTILKRKEDTTSLDEPLSLDMSDADSEEGPTNKSSREADGDAPVGQNSPKSDQDDDFTTFFDDDNDEDLRFFENDFAY